jgi:hypothetical protein
MGNMDIKKGALRAPNFKVRPEGFEPPTLGSEDLYVNTSSFYPCKGDAQSDLASLVFLRFFVPQHKLKTKCRVFAYVLSS